MTEEATYVDGIAIVLMVAVLMIILGALCHYVLGGGRARDDDHKDGTA